jgi:RNA polymerase sigma-70 factor (ECF subfamily)
MKNQSREPDFVNRFIEAQNALYAYVRSYGFNITDTEDLLQDVAQELWRCYPSYDPSHPFMAWAIGVTRNRVRTQLRRNAVRRKMIVDSEICEKISDSVEQAVLKYGSQFSSEREYLERCVDELQERSRRLIRYRYYENLTLQQIAGRVGKTYAAVNVALSRIRSWLMDCVSKRVREAV